jgi:CubicO group peptidase (beta-lactamase class C family)
MESSDSYRLDEVTPNLAIGYGRFEDDPLGIAPRRPNWMFLGWRGNACGGGYATAPDLVRFARALRGYKLLSKEMTETITTPKFSKRYGYGFITRTSAGKSIRGHGGGGPNSGVDTEMQIIWESGLTVIILSNYDAPFATDFCTKITDFLARQ